jgi:hypothetical protein
LPVLTLERTQAIRLVDYRKAWSSLRDEPMA